MASKTTVSQTYTPSLNVSVTEQDGQAVLITLWTTGQPKSTNRVLDLRVPFSHK